MHCVFVRFWMGSIHVMIALVVEQAAIAGALSAEAFADPSRAAELANKVAERMDMISDETRTRLERQSY